MGYKVLLLILRALVKSIVTKKIYYKRIKMLDLYSSSVQTVTIGHFGIAFSSVSKRFLVHNLSYETEILLHGHCLANQTHIHKKVVHLESLWRVFEAEVKSNSEPMLLEKDWVLLTSPKHSPIVNTPSLYNRHPKKPPNTPTNALKRMWAKKKKQKKKYSYWPALEQTQWRTEK